LTAAMQDWTVVRLTVDVRVNEIVLGRILASTFC
jgi:hypothetical protein